MTTAAMIDPTTEDPLVVTDEMTIGSLNPEQLEHVSLGTIHNFGAELYFDDNNNNQPTLNYFQQDIQIPVNETMTIAELFKLCGGEIKLLEYQAPATPKHTVCPDCNGTGLSTGNHHYPRVICPRCQGHGEIDRPQ